MCTEQPYVVVLRAGSCKQRAKIVLIVTRVTTVLILYNIRHFNRLFWPIRAGLETRARQCSARRAPAVLRVLTQQLTLLRNVKTEKVETPH